MIKYAWLKDEYGQTLRVSRMMDSLAQRFGWARIVVRCLLQLCGENHLRQTLLCNSGGSDTDFSGGAAAWEHAASMLDSAGFEMGLGIDVRPRATCDAWLHLKFQEHANVRAHMHLAS